MPTVLCECGQPFPAIPGASCPRCKAATPPADATAACSCGEIYIAHARWIGREYPCGKCGELFEVTVAEERTLAVVTRAREGTRTSPLRWLFLLFLLPLVFVTFASDDYEERLKRTIEEQPKARHLRDMDRDPEDVLDELEGHRIHGAWLPRESDLPWLFALIAVAGFGAAFRLLIPPGRATWKSLGLVALFTGTVGIFMLLLMQVVAFSGGGGIAAFIALMYLYALHPAAGFVKSLVGFTLGVGLLEELCKAAPLLWRFGGGNSRLDVRGAAAWGIASGVGFGINEGIGYSVGSYNGLATPGIYLVRFASCVALHGAWAATTAILLWRFQSDLADSWNSRLRAVALAMGGPMLLHGLYDAVLKQEWNIAALVVAAFSFAWFLWLLGRADDIEARMQGLAV